jgi:hypothetical protein
LPFSSPDPSQLSKDENATIATTSVSQKHFGLHGWLDREMFPVTCVTLVLQDQLQRKLHHVSAPLLNQTWFSSYQKFHLSQWRSVLSFTMKILRFAEDNFCAS